jgi:hypothetical protein
MCGREGIFQKIGIVTDSSSDPAPDSSSRFNSRSMGPVLVRMALGVE